MNAVIGNGQDGGIVRTARDAAWIVWFGALVLSAGPVLAQDGPSEADRRCLQCHGQDHIAELNPEERRSMVGTSLDPDGSPSGSGETVPLTGNEPAARPGLLVTRDSLGGSMHAGVSCVECHTDAAELPHPPELNLRTCGASCHSAESASYLESAHEKAWTAGDKTAPGCAACHGGHDIRATSNRNAPQHHLNSLFLCGDCHEKHRPNGGNGDGPGRVESYLDSAHAEGVTKAGLLGSATCADCHGAHGVFPAKDTRSTVNREQVPATCGKCHEGVNEVYAESIHGVLLAAGDDRGPVCTDCHTGHRISRTTSDRFVQDVVNECGDCHDSKAGESGKVSLSYETYRKSYHGQVTNLGSGRAARCSDCHGAHDIRPADDPASHVAKANLIATCGQTGCHESANANFVRFDPHANYRDADRFPILHGVWLYFVIMMSVVFSFFGLHSVLWFLRGIAHRRTHARHAPAERAETAIRRFTGLNRLNHLLVVVTFFGLTATGIPLIFSGSGWAQVLANLFGGVEAAGVWHRVFAVGLITNFVIHFIGLGRAFARRRVGWRAWVFGPTSMVPRWKDVTDCAGMLRWFIAGGSQPRMDRWAYWEKFDYWAEIGGSMIIGGSGLLLWFPQLASKILPGWIFNIATIVHGYEALLAIVFIFTIHFFNAHLRPGVFPVDEVIFTGCLPEQELKEHRPEEYERLIRTGAIESLRVPAPDPKRRPLFVLVAAVAMMIGTTLAVLIILGGLRVI